MIWPQVEKIVMKRRLVAGRIRGMQYNSLPAGGGGGGELLHGAPTCEVSFVSFHPEILVAPSVSQFSHSVVSDSL